ncbi:MAG: amidohydrolase family protein [Epsilonproteobacteria bacterium]|nr:amidohydrolase family protein [Campylobacterota bacterium]
MSLPKNSCDCHFHVFGPSSRYPYAINRSYTPKDSSLGEFFALLQTNGISRAVIVQPSVYDYDNSAILDALRAKPQQLRAIVVIDDKHDIKELKQWQEWGVRGVRVNLLFNSSVNSSSIQKLVKLIKPLGWHLQLLINISDYKNLYEDFKNIGVDIVFDHMGHFDIEKGVKQKGFQDMLRLLRENLAWVKLSGAYRVSNMPYPPYSDVIPFAKKIIEANQERVIWASDWPHPSVSLPTPQYEELIDLVEKYTKDEKIIKKIMVENPVKLYDFKNI